MKLDSRLSSYGESVVKRLSSCSTFSVGGPALCFYPETISAFIKSLEYLGNNSFCVIGCGSNILATDFIIKAPIVLLKKGEFSSVRIEKDGTLYCGAGITAGELLNFAVDNSIEGYEFAAGLPASIGGMIRMNASFKGISVADVLESVDFLDIDKKEVITKKSDEIAFRYRDLELDNKIVLGARLKVKPGKQEEISKKIKENVQYRKSHQEWGKKTAGCIFKNPSGSDPAGKLIEDCGLKGFTYGDAVISKKHGNFIVNNGKATSNEIIYLIDKIKEEVFKKKNIMLEEEIVRIEC